MRGLLCLGGPASVWGRVSVKFNHLAGGGSVSVGSGLCIPGGLGDDWWYVGWGWLCWFSFGMGDSFG